VSRKKVTMNTIPATPDFNDAGTVLMVSFNPYAKNANHYYHCHRVDWISNNMGSQR
jgi:hypothetical protein